MARRPLSLSPLRRPARGEAAARRWARPPSGGGGEAGGRPRAPLHAGDGARYGGSGDGERPGGGPGPAGPSPPAGPDPVRREAPGPGGGRRGRCAPLCPARAGAAGLGCAGLAPARGVCGALISGKRSRLWRPVPCSSTELLARRRVGAVRELRLPSGVHCLPAQTFPCVGQRGGLQSLGFFFL